MADEPMTRKRRMELYAELPPKDNVECRALFCFILGYLRDSESHEFWEACEQGLHNERVARLSRKRANG